MSESSVAREKFVAELAIPDRRGSNRARLVAILALVAAAGGGAVWYTRQSRGDDDRLRTEAVTRSSIVRVITITGHVDVLERVDVPAPLGGALVSIDVAPGDVVQEGDQLARLDPRRGELAVGSARATLNASASRVSLARAALDGARAQVAQIEQLERRELASASEVAGARLELERADATLRASRAEQSVAANQVSTAEMSLESGLLRAPIGGIILQAPRSLGSLVGPERGAIFVIGRTLDSLTIDADVGEADVGSLREGLAAWFEVPAHPGRHFDATLHRIELDATVGTGTVTFPVQFRATNPERILRPGMTALLHIEVARAENVLVVHEAALRFTPEGAPDAPPRSRIWVRTGPNRIEPVEVVAGVSDGAYTEVRPAHPNELRVGAAVAIGVRIDASGTAGLSLGSGTRRAGR